MTTLAVSSPAPAHAGSGSPLVTLQCDICYPPRIATNTLPNLVASNWMCRARGDSFDVCAVCRRRLLGRQLVPRREVVASQSFAAGAMPNFVIIGAAKCGTTSLHAYLDRHPDIAMSTVKEPQYFSDPDQEQWRAYYESLFRPDAPIRGESSTVYSRSPVVPGVAARMAVAVPDMRLIYMVRDPVDRAFASLAEERMHDNDTRAVEEAFADIDDPFNPYVAASRYAMQLGQYLETFDKPNFLVVEMEDLRTSPGEVLSRIYDFLGAEQIPCVGDQPNLNARDSKREYPRIARQLRSSPLLRTMYRLPERPRELLLQPLRVALSRRIRLEQPPLLRSRLQTALAPDIARFREMCERDFSHWSV